MRKSTREFAVECYSLSQQQLFAKCLELHEQVPCVEVESLNVSVTIEVSANKDGFIDDKEHESHEFHLGKLKAYIPNVVAIISDMPKELGLFHWEVVVVDRKHVEHKMIKAWIVPTADGMN